MSEAGLAGADGGELGPDAGGAAGSGVPDAMAAEGSSGSGGTMDAAGSIVDASTQDVFVDSAGGPDTITVPDCGQPGAPTRDTHSGIVTLRVSGIVQGSPGSFHDPFYFLGPGDNSTTSGACVDCLVYDHFAEGSCLCGSGVCAASHRVSEALVGNYPAFSATHDYTVQMDLGQGSSERINFGFYDCGCDDNAGSFRLTISP